MDYKVAWRQVNEFVPGDSKLVWAWDGAAVHLAVGYQAWNRDSDYLHFVLVEPTGTMRFNLPDVVLWADFLVPCPPSL